MDFYNKSLELDPKNFTNLCNRGKILYNFKKYDDAMKDFNCALQIEPYNIECLYMVDLIKTVNVTGIKKKNRFKNFAKFK